MKLHFITIGSPKLTYAKLGWEEYTKRLGHYHQLRVTHLADKYNDAKRLLEAAGDSYRVALTIDGEQFSSKQLAIFLETRAGQGKEVSFMIGGPEGLPIEVQQAADLRWSFGQLTYPHDLAMVILAESIYRASTINAGQPYHK